MTTISAQSILASCHADDPSKRIDTLLLRYPRFIHAEFMTHRLFSRNASSSRAIPVEKLIQSAIDEPAIPLHWGKNQKGMQADGEHDAHVEVEAAQDSLNGEPWVMGRQEAWLSARDDAVEWARRFTQAGYHKQIVNRLLEPFTHITVVCTSTNWSNFLHLRDHPDAEPHMQMLARAVREALDGAEVQKLKPGEWHLPFVSEAERKDAQFGPSQSPGINSLLALSVARCASTSYKTVDGFDMTIDRAVALHDKLVAADPLHASPCEHQAQVPAKGEGWKGGLGGNFGAGWCQYRKMLEGECR